MTKQNKICVYAICKNEIKFIDKWIESMNEADYIVVLDTGSTDGTLEKLQNDSRITTVKQEIINPWRFDVARNESMKLIPEDANICVCTDMDELFDKGWAEILRTRWDETKHYMAWYKYAWNHDNNGNPIRVFKYDKIHSRNGWKWMYPIHEGIAPSNSKEVFDPSRVLDVFDDIYLHHYQDNSKERSSYLPLLEIRRDENPHDLQTRAHLVHEYLYNSEFQKCIDEVDKTISEFSSELTLEFLGSLYLFKGDAYTGLRDDEKAINTYQKSIEMAPQFAEPHIALATVLMRYNKYTEVINVLKKCLAVANQYYVWFQRGVDCTEDTIYDLLSCSYFFLGEYDLALANVLKAIKLNPTNERVVTNYNLIAQAVFEPLGRIGQNSIVQ